MPRPPERRGDAEWDDAEDTGWDDRDDPQPSDVDEDEDETPTVECTACGHEVADFADRCPRCGEWIEQGGRAPRPGLLTLGVAVVLILALLALVLRVL